MITARSPLGDRTPRSAPLDADRPSPEVAANHIEYYCGLVKTNRRLAA
ncbi:MAG: hypothetical protein ACHRXM_31880 [Isosphaerales bacterium]